MVSGEVMVAWSQVCTERRRMARFGYILEVRWQDTGMGDQPEVTAIRFLTHSPRPWPGLCTI